MKQVIEFIVRVEIDDTKIDVTILDSIKEDESTSTVDYDGPLDHTVNEVEYITNIAYHGSEEEWYITYKE